MYTVTQESTDQFDGSISVTRVAHVRSYLRALTLAKRWRGSCTRYDRGPTVWASIDGREVPPRIVPSVGELGYW